jgi:putative two-component system response regulator
MEGKRSPLMQLAREIALCHHERWDGEGYPHGLMGEAIPLSARIVAVADVYDALVNKRPYKPAWSPDDALKEIRSQRGYHFDPQVVDAFVALFGSGAISQAA